MCASLRTEVWMLAVGKKELEWRRLLTRDVPAQLTSLLKNLNKGHRVARCQHSALLD